MRENPTDRFRLAKAERYKDSKVSLDSILGSDIVPTAIFDLVDEDFLSFYQELISADSTRRKRLMLVANGQIGSLSRIMNYLRYCFCLHLKIPDNLQRFEGRLEKLSEIIAQCRQRFLDINARQSPFPDTPCM